jgi:hypothetical protein
VIAATQGFINMDMVIGRAAREALLVNFNNLFFFSSHEEQVDRFAVAHFGLAQRSIQASVEVEDSMEVFPGSREARRRRVQAQIEDWVCPPGRLSRLNLNEAFVSMARGRSFSSPLWLEPLFYDAPIAGTEPPADSTGRALDLLRKLRRSNREKHPESMDPPCQLSKEFIVSQAGEPAEPTDASCEVGSSRPVQPIRDEPCVLLLTKEELNVLTGKEGIIERFIAAHSENCEQLRSSITWSGTDKEITLILPGHCIQALRKECPSNGIEKEFLDVLLEYLGRRESPF